MKPNRKSEERRAHTTEQRKECSRHHSKDRSMRHHHEAGWHLQQDIRDKEAHAQAGGQDPARSHPWRRIRQQWNSDSFNHKESSRKNPTIDAMMSK